MVALSRKNRLTDRKIISEVMRRGRKLNAKGLRMYVGGRTAGIWRAVVISPKKIDKRATTRNKLRRQVGEIIRQAMRSASPFNVVVYLEPGAAKLSFAGLKEELGTLLGKVVK